MKNIFGLVSLFLILSLISSFPAQALNHTMSWNFRLFNNPNARQVAFNIAQVQNDMVEEEVDPVADFQRGLERRLMSSIQRDIINKIMDESAIRVGDYQVGDLEIRIGEDPISGEVIVEIYNQMTGESSIITYSIDEFADSPYYSFLY